VFCKVLINKCVYFCWWQQWQQNNTFPSSENKNLIIPQFAELSKLNFWKGKKGFFPATAATKYMLLLLKILVYLFEVYKYILFM